MRTGSSIESGRLEASSSKPPLCRVAITHCRTGLRPPAASPGHLSPASYGITPFGRMDHLFSPFLTAPDHLRFWVDRHPGVTRYALSFPYGQNQRYALGLH